MTRKKKSNPDEDFEIVEEEEAGSTFSHPDIKKLKEKLKKCNQERQEYLTGWQRDKADFINARKKDEEYYKTQAKYATEDMIAQLLPVVDSFDMAFANKEVWESLDSNWRKGVEYIHAQLLKILEDNGLSKIEPYDAVFDPTMHESVGEVETKKKEEEGKIIEVVRMGYIIGGKVVRPLQVKVGIYKK